MFLAHHKDDPQSSLVEHSITVAKKTKEIIDDTKLDLADEGFFAGLLHDLGKINPIYQEAFSASKNEITRKFDKLESKFMRMHSPFSAWAVIPLLEKTTGLTTSAIDIVASVVYSHHSRLLRTLPSMDASEKFVNTQKAIAEKLPKFSEEAKDEEFSRLNWERCYQYFSRPIKFLVNLEQSSSKSMKDFVRISLLFSALLQADRGSFSHWTTPNFDLNIDTKALSTASNLAYLRDAFQKEAMQNHDFETPITVIHAPTGIGKTKLFLDLISVYKKKFKLSRVYYFSPLLALTDDFETKLSKTVTQESLDEILSYNHLFSGSLEEKNRYEMGGYAEYHWLFEDESFNRKFIITTTQRLLMTLYSNKHSDKLKLVSLRNSLLILDEVQTIPKYILTNLIEYLQSLSELLNCKILLISATIPYELSSLPRTTVHNKIIDLYLSKTKKDVVFSRLDLSNFQNEKVLVMANTKKKTQQIFSSLSENSNDEIFYLSTGIRKKDRQKIIQNLITIPSCVCVSTQVIEAGVDISFSQIYRELAPLDSIIQVMGRLNREAKYEKSQLTIFQQDMNWRPYSELEYNESLKVIKKISNSIELYSYLPEYYRQISIQNQRYKELTAKLSYYLKKMNFEEVWNFIYSNVLADDYQETVFVPENEELWKDLKNHILKIGRIDKIILRKYSYYTASLSKSPEKLGILDMFDEQLAEMNILLPKIEYLDEIYDQSLGLDKWLTQ